MDAHALSRCIDHTLLKTEATEAEIRQLVADAVRHRFAAVCVNPCWVKLVADLLEAAGVADAEQTAEPVLACTVAVFLIWLAFNYYRLTGDQNGVLRFVLGMLFALLILFRAKPEGSASVPLP